IHPSLISAKNAVARARISSRSVDIRSRSGTAPSWEVLLSRWVSEGSCTYPKNRVLSSHRGRRTRRLVLFQFIGRPPRDGGRQADASLLLERVGQANRIGHLGERGIRSRRRSHDSAHAC